MGILNVTPDSFSDGGRHARPEEAVKHAVTLLDEGADIIDIGGESTRPGAQPISTQEELDRVMPVINRLRQARKDAVLSIDTSKPAVMREAIAAGVALVNDVNALREPGAIEAVAPHSTVRICLMHTQGNPQSMQLNPQYTDVIQDVFAFLKARVAACKAAGIAHDRIIIDPGFGFGKTTAHNLQLLASLERFTALNLPILIGWSRKSSIGNILNRHVNERLYGSLAAAVVAFTQGASLIRTHDVKPTRDALLMTQAILQHRQGQEFNS